MQSDIARTTQRTYKQKVKRYKVFCKSNKLKTFSENSSCIFITYLARNLAFKTLLTYTAAIKKYIKRYRTASYVKRFTALKQLLLGLKRILCKTKRNSPRLPILHKELKLLKLYCSKLPCPQDGRMLWCAITFGFFGFLRASEMVSKSQSTYERSRTLTVSHVKLYRKHVKVHIECAKNDQYRNGTNVILAKNRGSCCPHRATKAYLHVRKPTDGPFLTFNDGTYLTNKKLNDHIRAALPHSINGKYSSHSLRIGAATVAASRGYPKYIIQKLGRWRSTVFKKYIRFNDATYIQISKGLATTN